MEMSGNVFQSAPIASTLGTYLQYWLSEPNSMRAGHSPSQEDQRCDHERL
jgi:hypothetical protein